MTTPILNRRILVICIICIITFFCFHHSLDNQFTNWDDDYYVTNVDYIKELNPHNLKMIFTDGLITPNKYQPNYHPLCMLSLAINYHFAQLNPTSYYATNIVIHVFNVIFVFLLFLQICALLKLEELNKLFIAGFGALLFGIHPMHVESVSWIAERKDVLYAFFYIPGLITYLKYHTSKQVKWYWITFGLFVLSCLSKPMAVVFPASLICLDFVLNRKISQKLVVEKIIFFLFSLLCGGAAFYTQNKTGAIASFGVLTIQERFMYAAYSFIMYISKFFNPTYLSTFYPYPFRYTSGNLHTIFYFAPILGASLLGIPLFITYKKNKTYFRIALFGLGFFVANVIFVLQFISVGAAIMADRYSYIAYIGLIFFILFFLYEIANKFTNLKMGVLLLMVLFSIGMAYLCNERTNTWHDAESLLTDAIEKYPVKKDLDKDYDKKNTGIAGLSYKWLGNYYFHKGDFNKAMENFEVIGLLHLTDQYVEDKIAHINMLKNQGRYMDGMAAMTGADDGANGVPAQAMNALNQKMAAPTGDYQKYLDSSFYFAKKGDTLKAFKTYINAFRFNQGVERIYADSCFKAVQSRQYDLAINQYGVIMKINTGNPYYYFYRGVAQFSKNKMKVAIGDWEIALKLKSKEIEQSASYNLSVAYDSVGNDSLAVHYAEMAKNLGYTVNEDFLNKLRAKKAKQRKK